MPAEALVGPPPLEDRLGTPALVAALTSFLVPGGLMALAAFYLAGKAMPGPRVRAARILGVVSLGMWAVILVAAAVVVWVL
ncbi:MAG: hypothetical protein ACT4OS_04640 [Acidimicrobiales bacterium]